MACLMIVVLTGCVCMRKENLRAIEKFSAHRIDKKISVEVEAECYTRGGYRKSCSNYREDLLKTMENSKLFGMVGVNEYYADYRADIKYIRDDNYSVVMTLISFLPSLGIIPKFESDKFFVTVEVTNIKTNKHKKVVLSDRMFNVSGLIVLPYAIVRNPAHDYLKLKQDFLDNITAEIYKSILELE